MRGRHRTRAGEGTAARTVRKTRSATVCTVYGQ